MKIRYQVTQKDMIAFNDCYHIKCKIFSGYSFTNYLNTIIKYTMLFTVLSIVLFSKTIPLKDFYAFFNGALLISCLISIWMSFWIVPRNYQLYGRSVIKYLIKKFPRYSPFGEETIELNEDHLYVKKNNFEIKMGYQAILKIVEDTYHLYIFFTPVGGLIIPHLSVIEGDLDEFMKVLESKVDIEIER